jgi:hypothetical protein
MGVTRYRLPRQQGRHTLMPEATLALVCRHLIRYTLRIQVESVDLKIQTVTAMQALIYTTQVSGGELQ